MKRPPLLLLLAAAITCCNLSLLAQVPADLAVPVTAVVQADPPTISLKWPTNNTAVSYVIYKKTPNATTWGAAIATLPGSATGYDDANVVTDSLYEYRVVRNGQGISATGYLLAGINYIGSTYRGRCLVVIDTTATTGIDFEVQRLLEDISGDGWAVETIAVAATDPVQYVKDLIKTFYQTYSDLKAIFLLGHVPVPYSGNLNPDGHPDHLGAWPFDAWYGDMDGSYTDHIVNNTTATRQQNWNVPGDGKFDQSAIAGNIELMVGRADMANLPAFGLSENQLLQRYLDKNHGYRNALFTPKARALIDDHFGYFGGEAFAAVGWRNFPPLVHDSIVAADYLSELTQQSFLWSYGCGPGSYTAASGVGTTYDFAADTLLTVFTFLFGSYFGDWDSDDNFLRAPLAAAGFCLANAWAGRPFWYVHYMAMGLPLGYSFLKTVNNSSTYLPNLAAKWIHIALMGDPTLRLHYRPPCAWVKATFVPDSGFTQIIWPAAPDSLVMGYYVFRSADRFGVYQPVSALITDTFFVDENPPVGTQWYMVRAATNQTTPSGSWLNLSTGRKDSAQVLFSALKPARPAMMSCFPNPASSFVVVKNLPTNVDYIQLIRMDGVPVHQWVLPKSSASNNLLLPLPRPLAAGTYLLRVAPPASPVITLLVVQE